MPIRPGGPSVRQTLVLPRETLAAIEDLRRDLNTDRPVDPVSGIPAPEISLSRMVSQLCTIALGTVEEVPAVGVGLRVSLGIPA